MKAYRNHLEKFNPECRDFKDNRKKVSRAIFSYITDSGIEYRKSFESVPNTPEIEFWDIAPKQIDV